MDKGESLDSLCSKDRNGKKDFLPVEFLEGFYDQFEAYQIMSEVFFRYIPDHLKIIAMSNVADVIVSEKKNES